MFQEPHICISKVSKTKTDTSVLITEGEVKICECIPRRSRDKYIPIFIKPEANNSYFSFLKFKIATGTMVVI